MNRVQKCSKELHEAMTASGLIKPTSSCMVDSVVRSFVLLQRWHDPQRDEWTPWEEIPKEKLCHKYGAKPAEWKEACRMWISLGGRYEYRIVERVDSDVWSLSFHSANRAITNKEDER